MIISRALAGTQLLRDDPLEDGDCEAFAPVSPRSSRAHGERSGHRQRDGPRKEATVGPGGNISQATSLCGSEFWKSIRG